jgi:hypothetical protein
VSGVDVVGVLEDAAHALNCAMKQHERLAVLDARDAIAELIAAAEVCLAKHAAFQLNPGRQTGHEANKADERLAAAIAACKPARGAEGEG